MTSFSATESINYLFLKETKHFTTKAVVLQMEQIGVPLMLQGRKRKINIENAD
jgi:hypothetical protein